MTAYFEIMRTAQAAVWGFVKGGSLVLGLLGVALYSFQGKILYAPYMPQGSREHVPNPSQFKMTDWEEVTLTSPDRVKLQAFIIYAAPSSASPSSASLPAGSGGREYARSRPTVLMLHANAGNVGHRLPLARVFVSRFGCNVVALSYRGYGRSEGSPNEQGILMDAQTALDWATSHEVLGGTRVVVYGQSLGGAVAVALASAKGNEGRIHGMILENTFTSIRQLIPTAMPILTPFAFLCHQTWETHLRLPRLSASVPSLFLSGAKDELVPSSHMRALFEMCPSKVKVWKSLPDGTHNDTCVQPNYFAHIGEFLRDQVGWDREPACELRDTLAADKARGGEKCPKAEGAEALSRSIKPLL